MRAIIRIVRYSRQLWPLYGLIGFFTVVLALLAQAQPLLIKSIVDRLVAGLDGQSVATADILWFVGLIFAADAATTLISNIAGYWGDVMAMRLRQLMTLDYFNHLMRLPQSYFDSEKTGAIMNRLDRGLTEIRTFMNILANNFLQFILSTVFTLVIIAYYSWEIALLLGILFPIFLYLTQRTSRGWQEHQAKLNELADKARARFTETIAQVKVVKAFVRETAESRYQAKNLRQSLGITKKQSREWHKRDVERRLVLNVIFLAVFAIIGLKGARGELTIGEIVLLVQYTANIRLPLFSMSFIVDNTQRAVAGSREFFDVMSIKPDIQDRPGAGKLSVKHGAVRFEDVNFAYANGQSVLRGISFEVAAGQKVALVGESGQGKTTISNLLLRLYEPTSGRILIDSQDIVSVRQASLRAAIGVVFQDPALFSGTVRENIALGRPGAAQDELERAAKAANAHDFIRNLPDGYDTEIGERGIKLSGGQQQRIAIARAILNDPPLLILDEATSSLDSKSEAQVQSALERLMSGRTTLIIAHRLSTIKDVETIVTLKDGRVDEVGPPAELARSGGIYSQLLKLQSAKNSHERADALKQFDLVN